MASESVKYNSYRNSILTKFNVLFTCFTEVPILFSQKGLSIGDYLKNISFNPNLTV